MPTQVSCRVRIARGRLEQGPGQLERTGSGRCLATAGWRPGDAGGSALNGTVHASHATRHSAILGIGHGVGRDAVMHPRPRAGMLCGRLSHGANTQAEKGGDPVVAHRHRGRGARRRTRRIRALATTARGRHTVAGRRRTSCPRGSGRHHAARHRAALAAGGHRTRSRTGAPAALAGGERPPRA